jgi:hypothetical protein
MQTEKFIEHLSPEDNSKMLFSIRIKGYSDDERINNKLKDEIVFHFMSLLKLNNSDSEVSSIETDFGQDEGIIVKLTLNIRNGKMSQAKIREAINNVQGK